MSFLAIFKICFPKRRITPKMHHMVHYPRYIRLFGPLNAVWCMRYEGKHAYFGQILKIVGNFINVPSTLAYRHQQWMCSKLWSSKERMLEFDVVGSQRFDCVSLIDLPYGGQVANLFSPLAHTFGEYLVSA